MLNTKQLMKFLVFFFIITLYYLPASAGDALESNYVIGPGDILDISVWKNTELTKLVPVLPDGHISFPLIGEIKAEGKTLAQFHKDIESKLIHYIPQPSLSVMIQKVNMNIYVIGKVNKPGMFGINTNINVLQALTMAGGLNPFAKRNEIRIFRKIDNETRIYEFEYDDVSIGQNLDQNIDLKRGDIIVVP